LRNQQKVAVAPLSFRFRNGFCKVCTVQIFSLSNEMAKELHRFGSNRHLVDFGHEPPEYARG